MFQSLRSGTPFYVFYKDVPKLIVGEVESVGVPTPQYGTTYQNGVLTQPSNLVDVKVRADGETIMLQKLPADATIADFGVNGMVVSESKDAIDCEIRGFMKISEKAISEEELKRHTAIVEACKEMRERLNPQLAQEAEQTRRLDSMESRIANMESMLTKALGRSSKSKEE